MKYFIRITAFSLCIVLLFCGCAKNSETPVTNSRFQTPTFTVHENLMTTEQYHEKLKDLLAGYNFTHATSEQLSEIDDLGDRLKDMIIYNTDDITECKGTKYYVSNSGNDENDGKPRNCHCQP